MSGDSDIREFPHAVGPEKAVLSVIMQYPEMLDEAPFLTPDHFYDPGRRKLFEILAERIRGGLAVEFVSLTQGLLDSGRLEAIGGPGVMSDIYTYQPSPGHFQGHIADLNRKLACRMAINAAVEITRVAYESPEPEELIAVTSAPITEIHDTITSNRPSRDTKSLLKAFFSEYQERCTGKAAPRGMHVSLPKINEMFGGIHHSQTVVISAYPSGGKTALAVQFAMDLSLEGRNALVCSLEMTDSKLIERVISYVGRIDGKAVSDPLGYARGKGYDKIPQKITDSVGKAVRAIHKFPFQIEDLTGANVHQISAVIRRAHRKAPLDVVVVDFAQRISSAPEKLRETREQQLSHASNTLANLAKELGFCLILPSQLNENGTTKHAATINEDADLHLQITQDKDKQHTGITVSKDRHHGHAGESLPIVLDTQYLRFKEVSHAEMATSNTSGKSRWDK